VVLKKGSEEGGIPACVFHLVNAVHTIANAPAGGLEGLCNPVITSPYVSLVFHIEDLLTLDN
jgi:hypothetical protein